MGWSDRRWREIVGSRTQTQRELDEALERRLGVGGGIYASEHTARADPWYIVVWESPSLGERTERVQAHDAAFARIAVERKLNRRLYLFDGAKVTAIAREEWRRL